MDSIYYKIVAFIRLQNSKSYKILVFNIRWASVDDAAVRDCLYCESAEMRLGNAEIRLTSALESSVYVHNRSSGLSGR